jgi:flagellar biosynthesis protein FlhF
MKLKTYTAETMAQALAHVRKDLGKDAMILHTRSYRVGSWFGIGGKTMVEITASSPSIVHRSNPARQLPTVTKQLAPTQLIEPKPIAKQAEIITQRGRTRTHQRLEHNPVASPTDSVGSRRTDTVHTKTTGQDIDNLSGRDALFEDETEKNRPSKPVNHSKPRVPTERTQMRSRFDDLPVARGMVANAKPMPPKPKVTNQARVTAKSPDPDRNEDQDAENAQLSTQIESLQKMMGQVLESTRKTAVAVGTNSTDAALPSGEMPAPLFALYAKMMDNDVPVDQADKLVGVVRDRLDALELKDPIIVRQALLREIESTIRTRSESLLTLDDSSSTDRPRVIALVGPTGVGKTTTVAKLAATYKLRHAKKVGLITSDTYRIAAVEQLRTYAGIIGLPLKVANSPEEMCQVIEELSACDIVVIDTAGRSQNDARKLDELAQMTKSANPDETHLVLSTTVGDNVLRKTAQRFRALGPDRCILTKLDEAVTTGPIAGLCDRIDLPLSFITVGQEVPDDLEPARVDRLARCVLDGPEAVVRWNEDNG